MRALELGWRHLKFFPAETYGGVNALKALSGPFGHTGVKFIPTGGITAATLPDYLALPAGCRRWGFVDGRAETCRGQSLGQNYSADHRSYEIHQAGKIISAVWPAAADGIFSKSALQLQSAFAG